MKIDDLFSAPKSHREMTRIDTTRFNGRDNDDFESNEVKTAFQIKSTQRLDLREVRKALQISRVEKQQIVLRPAAAKSNTSHGSGS